MMQLVILSGKGGTGKTTIAAAFAQLAAEEASKSRNVLVDADVDAANLALLLQPKNKERYEYWGGQIARIEPELCSGCGLCQDLCGFDAVVPANGYYRIDELNCEGCGACFFSCPNEAIALHQQLAGEWFKAESRYGPLVHAALRPGQENSGKLVACIKSQAEGLAKRIGADLMIVDGSPGIGCPAIAAASGADLALIVAEPSAAGVHDLGRIERMLNHFGVPVRVCVNKSDLFTPGVDQIRELCEARGLELIAELPFDGVVAQAMAAGRPVTAYRPLSGLSRQLEALWNRLSAELESASVQRADA
ncbi:MAG: ATP-binding protein [Anaerolineales bacterium]